MFSFVWPNPACLSQFIRTKCSGLIGKCFQSSDGKVQFVFKKVAVVEKFFDIIYSVHVESSSGDTQLRGRAGKHCGQKRTYRAVSYSTFQLY